MIIFTVIISTLHEKNTPGKLDDSDYTFDQPIDFYLGFRQILSGWKRLKAQVSKCVIDEYKRLEEVMTSDNQLFMKIIHVTAKGEVWE